MEFTEYLRSGNAEIFDALFLTDKLLQPWDIKELVDILYRIDLISERYGGKPYHSLIAQERFFGFEEPDDGLFG